MVHKKFLPYSKPLHEMQRKGFAPDNYVNLYIGTGAWEKAKVFSLMHPERTLVLPAWQDPLDFHWPVKMCDIMIFDTGYANDDYVNDVAYCLFDNGAKVVHFVNTDLELIIFNK